MATDANASTWPGREQVSHHLRYQITGLYENISTKLNDSLDDRLVEYGFKSVLFDRTSAFQRIQIFSTVDFGNVLVLDGLVNLAESDRVGYTHSLLGLPEVRTHLKQRFLFYGGVQSNLACLCKSTTGEHHESFWDEIKEQYAIPSS